MKAREKLKIGNSVSLTVKNSKIVITREDESKGNRISRNHYETAQIV